MLASKVDLDLIRLLRNAKRGYLQKSRGWVHIRQSYRWTSNLDLYLQLEENLFKPCTRLTLVIMPILRSRLGAMTMQVPQH